MNRSNWKRIVVKVGSALIAPNRQGCSSHYLLSIAQFIVRCRMQGIQVVLEEGLRFDIANLIYYLNQQFHRQAPTHH